jgi:hypothetical protein
VNIAHKVIIAALVIFASGLVTGALAHRIYTQPARSPQVNSPAPWVPSPPHRDDLLARMERKLNLTPEQKSRIEQIFQESHERMQKIWEPVHPLARQEFQRVREEIRAELNPEQQQKYEEVFRHKGRHHPGGRKERPGQPPPPQSGAPQKPGSEC